MEEGKGWVPAFAGIRLGFVGDGFADGEGAEGAGVVLPFLVGLVDLLDEGFGGGAVFDGGFGDFGGEEPLADDVVDEFYFVAGAVGVEGACDLDVGEAGVDEVSFEFAFPSGDVRRRRRGRSANMSQALPMTPKSGWVKLESQIISEQAMRPPGLRTRLTSSRTAAVSGTCMRRLWQWATSKYSFSKGRSTASARWNCNVVESEDFRGFSGDFELGFFNVYAVEFAWADCSGEADGDGSLGRSRSRGGVGRVGGGGTCMPRGIGLCSGGRSRLSPDRSPSYSRVWRREGSVVIGFAA